jgi:predicted Zn-dependent peptidase
LIEGVGGALNAFTSEEQTCFYAKIPSQHLEQTFDVLADMVAHPKITAADVAKEKTVIVEEIKMYRDLPQFFVLELLDGLLWPGHPLGKNLPGTPQSVTGMSNNDLLDFHRTHYASGNVVVAACGKMNHAAIVRLARNRLGKIHPGGAQKYIPCDNSQAQARVKLYKKEMEQMHLAFGVLGYDEGNEDRHALNLLGIILGGNMSSRLFVEVREKRGWAYSISATAKSMHDTGVFLVRAGVDNQKIADTSGLILGELNKIKRNGVGHDEFVRARDYLLGQTLLGLEDTMEHMLWIGDTLISRNKVRTLRSVIRDFEKLTPDDIKRVANDILKPCRFNLAVVGPLTDGQQKALERLICA